MIAIDIFDGGSRMMMGEASFIIPIRWTDDDRLCEK